jgi:hypothetical protein
MRDWSFPLSFFNHPLNKSCFLLLQIPTAMPAMELAFH